MIRKGAPVSTACLVSLLFASHASAAWNGNVPISAVGTYDSGIFTVVPATPGNCNATVFAFANDLNVTKKLAVALAAFVGGHLVDIEYTTCVPGGWTTAKSIVVRP